MGRSPAGRKGTGVPDKEVLFARFQLFRDLSYYEKVRFLVGLER